MRRAVVLAATGCLCLAVQGCSVLKWSAPIALNDGQGLTSIACPSGTQCTAGDGAGAVVTFDPVSPDTPAPTTIDSSGVTINAIACPSSTQCTAIDTSGRELTFNPHSPGTPTPVTINTGATTYARSIACPSTTQCTAVLGRWEVTFDPTAPGTPTPISIDPRTSSGGGTLYNVSCPSTSQCTAVDTFGGRELTFDPTAPGTPTPVTIDSGPSDQSGPDGLACPTTTQCTAVDTVGNEVTFNPNASGSTTQSIDGTAAVQHIACASTTLCLATDGGPNPIEINPTASNASMFDKVNGAAALTNVSCGSASQCVLIDGSNGSAIVATPPPVPVANGPYFSALSTGPTTPRYGAVAAPLPNGQVMIAGGGPVGNPGPAFQSAELFNPANDSFTALPASGSTELQTGREYAVAAPLPSGQVLIAGGDTWEGPVVQSAELFDPANDSFTALPASGSTELQTARDFAVAAPLPNGQVLIAGGYGVNGPTTVLQSAELFDPANDSFTALPASGSTELQTGRYDAVAATLPNGQVLIAGGRAFNGATTVLRSAELFNPANGSFTALPASGGSTELQIARYGAVAVPLPNGQVLIAGGNSGGSGSGPLASAELFNPANDTFTALPASGSTELQSGPKQSAVAAPLPNGQVLIAGGVDGNMQSADLYFSAP